jgi:hypothetical protein
LNRIPLCCWQAEWQRKVGCSCHYDALLNAAPLTESQLVLNLFFTTFLNCLQRKFLLSNVL